MRLKKLCNPYKDKSSLAIDFAKHEFILDSKGGLYWPKHQLLIVSDLHLEKASFLASYGQPLPLYDTKDTLTRLEALIQHYKPSQLLTLGDNFHDMNALSRIDPNNLNYLKYISSYLDQWLWIIGNHDEKIKFSLVKNLSFHQEYCLDEIVFTHQLSKKNNCQIVGHYHPKVSIKKISGKCFVFTPQSMILPAFGSFTGGLDIHSVEFKKATQLKFYQAYMLYNQKLWYAG